MKILFTLLALFIGINTQAQNAFDVVTTKDNDEVIYRGLVNFDDLRNQLSFKWLDKGTEKYKPDAETIDFLKKHLATYKMVVFLGTWCEDSQNLVPKLYKVLKETGYPMKQYMMYGVDRDKRSLGDEQKMYKVTMVPTIILYKKNVEVGRITETVEKSIEKDLRAIIEKDQPGIQ